MTMWGGRATSFGMRYVLLLPITFVVILLIAPLGLTFVWSFWRSTGFGIEPAFTLLAYADFLSGPRLFVLERTLLVALMVTGVGLGLGYPIAYFLGFRASTRLRQVALMLFTVPFVVNPIIRTIGWTYLLGRTGPVNRFLVGIGITDGPVDWLLFSDFAVFLGLVASYMPFMIFPLWLALSRIDRQVIEASWTLGANPAVTFVRVIWPLSMPGIFAAVIFSLVGTFGETAVPVILGGVGYQLIGNTIVSALDALNYPLAAAISSATVLTMVGLLTIWLLLFDVRLFLGRILERR